MDGLDGNAAGGALGAVFRLEVTAGTGRCAACGAVRPLGAVRAFVTAMGTVLRCPDCDAELMRLSSDDGRYWLDARGLGYLELRSAGAS
jgi:hypothetical protein